MLKVNIAFIITGAAITVWKLYYMKKTNSEHLVGYSGLAISCLGWFASSIGQNNLGFGMVVVGVIIYLCRPPGNAD